MINRPPTAEAPRLWPAPARAAEPPPGATAPGVSSISPGPGGPTYEGGWLCPTPPDRARLIDMSPAVRRSRLFSSLFCGLGVVALTPWHPVLLLLFAFVPLPLFLLDHRLSTSERPERMVASSQLFFALLMLAGVALSGGVSSPILPWIAIPVVTAAGRFRVRVFLVAFVIAVVGLIAACVAASPASAWSHPEDLIAILALLAALVASQQPLLSAEQRWRRDAILDPLTGLLNRQGLQGRFEEIAEQARLTAAPVSLVACDLDNFKALNDTYGHSRGDAVLKDVAYLMRKELRAFELIYRIGGEELLLVLPGAEAEAAYHLAEGIRSLIDDGRPAGLPVTASFGVSSAGGADIEFGPMFEAADAALYAAKAAGRNQVVSASS
jgi:diguanylate cyclase (GGDEF)-like protein